jgi:hypothetical protein
MCLSITCAVMRVFSSECGRKSLSQALKCGRKSLLICFGHDTSLAAVIERGKSAEEPSKSSACSVKRLRTVDAAAGCIIEVFFRYANRNRFRATDQCLRFSTRRFGCRLCGGPGNEPNPKDNKQQSDSDDFLHANLSLLHVNLFVEYGSADILARFGIHARAQRHCP